MPPQLDSISNTRGFSINVLILNDLKCLSFQKADSKVFQSQGEGSDNQQKGGVRMHKSRLKR